MVGLVLTACLMLLIEALVCLKKVTISSGASHVTSQTVLGKAYAEMDTLDNNYKKPLIPGSQTSSCAGVSARALLNIQST